MLRFSVLLSLVLTVFAVAACGGDKKADPPRDPVENVPNEAGIRQSVQDASTPEEADFPPSKGKTLQQLADGMAAGPSLAMASSVFTTPGPSRMAFGMIAADGTPVYGPSAIYVAPTPNDPAVGPFVAVYGAEIEFPKKGKYAVLATTKKPDGSLTGATGQIDVSSVGADPIPRVGDKAPKVETETLASAGGDIAKIDTRDPPSDMHKVSFADVVGKKPVALLFSTPQLCASRVCGPVTDMELQMQSKYGDDMTFIHQEVWQDNDLNKGLRKPLQEFNLPTEPWLFVVDKSGKITARLEGSIGVRQFEDAVKSGL